MNKIKEDIIKNKSYLIILVIIFLILAVFVSKQIIIKKSEVSSNSINLYNNVTTKIYKVYNFGSALCPACRQMDPIYEKIKEEYKSVMNFEYIDIYKNFTLPDTYGIEYTPTFIVVDETGKEVDKLIGYVPEKEFRKFVDKWGNK